ncbi:MAG: hypothetical protein DRJ40_09465 [Thermoprotei archaeon]|nr:MAG: hypothetical protein DRJ40_09465 [Thermoprotei archaeon]
MWFLLSGVVSVGEVELARCLVSKFSSEVVPVLERIPSDTDRFLYFIAWLSSELEGRGLGRIVIVGGFAVEVLTQSTYRTLDVDIVVEGPGIDVVKRFLELLSHARSGRVFVLRLSALARKGIDVVGSSYRKPRDPIALRVDDYRVYIEPPEELIVTYLCAWKYWRSLGDRDKVLILLGVYWDRIDREYLVERCRVEGVEDKLFEALRVLGYG